MRFSVNTVTFISQTNLKLLSIMRVWSEVRGRQVMIYLQ